MSSLPQRSRYQPEDGRCYIAECLYHCFPLDIYCPSCPPFRAKAGYTKDCGGGNSQKLSYRSWLCCAFKGPAFKGPGEKPKCPKPKVGCLLYIQTARACLTEEQLDTFIERFRKAADVTAAEIAVAIQYLQEDIPTLSTLPFLPVTPVRLAALASAATSAVPAIPAAPAASATPVTPATPATPAAPATPATPVAPATLAILLQPTVRVARAKLPAPAIVAAPVAVGRREQSSSVKRPLDTGSSPSSPVAVKRPRFTLPPLAPDVPSREEHSITLELCKQAIREAYKTCWASEERLIAWERGRRFGDDTIVEGSLREYIRRVEAAVRSTAPFPLFTRPVVLPVRSATPTALRTRTPMPSPEPEPTPLRQRTPSPPLAPASPSSSASIQTQVSFHCSSPEAESPIDGWIARWEDTAARAGIRLETKAYGLDKQLNAALKRWSKDRTVAAAATPSSTK